MQRVDLDKIICSSFSYETDIKKVSHARAFSIEQGCFGFLTDLSSTDYIKPEKNRNTKDFCSINYPYNGIDKTSAQNIVINNDFNSNTSIITALNKVDVDYSRWESIRIFISEMNEISNSELYFSVDEDMFIDNEFASRLVSCFSDNETNILVRSRDNSSIDGCINVINSLRSSGIKKSILDISNTNKHVCIFGALNSVYDKIILSDKSLFDICFNY